MKRIIGFQLADALGVNITGDGDDPLGMASFEVISPNTNFEALFNNLLGSDRKFLLMPIFDGDIEEPVVVMGQDNSATPDLLEALTATTASLVAAISLLERAGKPAKRAAPSDKMFDMMLSDYRKAVDAARAAIAKAEGK